MENSKKIQFNLDLNVFINLYIFQKKHISFNKKFNFPEIFPFSISPVIWRKKFTEKNSVTAQPLSERGK